MELIINGRYDEAFSHLLLFGLASILEDADDSRICTIRWIDRTHAGIDVSDNLSWEDCATVIRDHAHRWSMSSQVMCIRYRRSPAKRLKMRFRQLEPHLVPGWVLPLLMIGGGCWSAIVLGQLMICRRIWIVVISVRLGNPLTGQVTWPRKGIRQTVALLGGRW